MACSYSGARWAEVVAQLEAMKARGSFVPADEKRLDQARQNAAKEKTP
jgi:hypothetical protein